MRNLYSKSKYSKSKYYAWFSVKQSKVTGIAHGHLFYDSDGELVSFTHYSTNRDDRPAYDDVVQVGIIDGCFCYSEILRGHYKTKKAWRQAKANNQAPWR